MKYFSTFEFDSPDSPGSGMKMDLGFLKMLDKAREVADIPFVITSGYRTPQYNDRVGGVDGSAHTRGFAADIACRDSVSRYNIIKSLQVAGFTRIGIASTFIHVDNDPDKPQEVIWVY
ncbi:D-Ala-D-Ala carboxypeptidase family metallohydrolase [Robiginitalea biformata]|uniref:Peptidase M15A C-terminal domain-containing protein n=1 Tax=Robiginitalea biformata (strain ATCC BAA-864 / DSM 15991 / KCTC 12146 / HTCC2501) TaxID=313596 RepID=A4CP44_ROBBH|nr:D-Ala-D-Ala carboxypeptidase family metallohydrolase [Robiginitalea biformata]EAR14661.1 hypothetical protein RB2501_01256 [Robiginitalea biformata HTCC2501]